MSWLEDLYRTYENNKEFVGKFDDVSTLFPIAHSTQNAQLEIAIDMQGNFRRAELVEKINAVTMIPVTEDSASRSSGIAPHPLCDKLAYVAEDYEAFTGKKGSAAYHQAYMESLKRWHESEFSHPKVDAVYRYLEKGNIIRDVVGCDVLKIGDDGLLLQSEKNQNIAQADFFIRFRVESPFSGDDVVESTATWQDMSLAQSFVNYYCSIQGSEGLCFVKGEVSSCSDKHPSKIRHSGDKAKLISSNDTSGFTFRGNYATSSQLLSIGYETSQKAHNALRWLLQRQGYKRVSVRKKGTDGKPEYKKSAIRSVVAWEVHDFPIPQPTDSSDEMLEDAETMLWNESEPASVSVPLTQKAYGERIAQAIEGYVRGFEFLDIRSKEDARVVVMAVDAATTGRLAVTYYQRIEGSTFLNRMKEWYNSCFWEFTERIHDKTETFVRSPSLKQIATLAFGTEQGSFIKIGNDSLLRSQVERLIPCVLDAAPIPRDIISSLVNRASMPLAYEFYNWRDLLAVACALIRKDHYDRFVKGGGGHLTEEWGLRLQPDCADPNYLFGRLLAVADRAEFSTFKQGENRQTNAKQLFFLFTQRPQQTWQSLAQKLQVYFSKMPLGVRRYFEKWLAQISSMFSIQSFNTPGKLSELYLLGFYHQGMAMRKTSDKEQLGNEPVVNELVENEDVENETVENEGVLSAEKENAQQQNSTKERQDGVDGLCLDRSYLFGRLFAIADYIEERSIGFEKERTTLVKNHFAALMQRPASTWQYVFARLQPYLSKMGVEEEQKYCFTLEKVYQLITDEQEAGSDIPLGRLAILGFYQQKDALLWNNQSGSIVKADQINYHLNEDSQNRNYIYGRLFAITDWIEILTFEQDERRDTNTRRLFSVLPGSPGKKWKLLKEKTQVYFRKLGKRKPIFESLLQTVEEKLPREDGDIEIPLDPVYLQGYFHQKMMLRKRYPKFYRKRS